MINLETEIYEDEGIEVISYYSKGVKTYRLLISDSIRVEIETQVGVINKAIQSTSKVLREE